MSKHPKVKGEVIISYTLEALKIRPAQLAAFLDVKAETVNDWREKPLSLHSEDKSARVVALHHVIKKALECGIEKRLLIPYLTEPTLKLGQEKVSIFHIIVNLPQSPVLIEMAEMAVVEFSKIETMEKVLASASSSIATSEKS